MSLQLLWSERQAPSHLAPNSNNPRECLIRLGTHAHHIVSHSFEPMNGAGGMSYYIWPDEDHLVATWLDIVIVSSIRLRIKVGKWMGEEQFCKGREAVMDRQKQQLSTKNTILLSFGRITHCPQIWSSFGELKTKVLKLLNWVLNSQVMINIRGYIWMILILCNY